MADPSPKNPSQPPNKDRPSRDRAAVQNGLEDLLGSVIRRDREQAGRPQTPPPSETPLTPQISDPEESAPETEHTAALSAEAPPMGPDPAPTASDTADGRPATPGKTARKADKARSPRTALASRGPAPNAPDEAARVEAAEALSRTPTMTVTLRIPQGLNDWLDEYVHRSWPQRIRKQELVVEALRMAYARRGLPGEDIVPTSLLGEEEEA